MGRENSWCTGMSGALPVHLSGRLFMRALLALPCMVLEQLKGARAGGSRFLATSVGSLEGCGVTPGDVFHVLARIA